MDMRAYSETTMSVPCEQMWVRVEGGWSELVKELGSNMVHEEAGIKLTVDTHEQQIQLKGTLRRTFLRAQLIQAQIVRDDHKQEVQFNGTLLFKIGVRMQLVLYPLTHETSGLRADINVTFPRGLKGWLVMQVCKWGCKRFAKKTMQETLQQAVEAMTQGIKQAMESSEEDGEHEGMAYRRDDATWGK